VLVCSVMAFGGVRGCHLCAICLLQMRFLCQQQCVPGLFVAVLPHLFANLTPAAVHAVTAVAGNPCCRATG
jgi:hypothetical protein